MQWRNTHERYGAVAQLLHWGMFAFIALQLVGGEVLDELPRKSAIRAFAFDAHESLGLLLLALLALRLAWRLANPAPAPEGPSWQRVTARVVHASIYALLIAIPVAGYVMACAKGHGAAFFGFDLPSLVGKSEALAERAGDVHEALANALIAIVVVHAAAALWHHWIARDLVLRRMLPRRRGEGQFRFRH
jgi:cytochrome b561